MHVYNYFINMNNKISFKEFIGYPQLSTECYKQGWIIFIFLVIYLEKYKKKTPKKKEAFMETGFSALDIVFLVVLAIFIISRFMGHQLPKDDKKNHKKVVKFPMNVAEEIEESQTKPKPKVILPEKELKNLSGVELIKKADLHFNEKEFLSGAELAYQMYYDAINDMDEETLENMIAPRKFDEIMESIETLESEGKKRLVKIDKLSNIEILDAKLHGRTAIIDVKYTAMQTDVIEDLETKVADVKADAKEITSVWTWARSIDSDDLNWELETMALIS